MINTVGEEVGFYESKWVKESLVILEFLEYKNGRRGTVTKQQRKGENLCNLTQLKQWLRRRVPTVKERCLKKCCCLKDLERTEQYTDVEYV